MSLQDEINKWAALDAAGEILDKAGSSKKLSRESLIELNKHFIAQNSVVPPAKKKTKPQEIFSNDASNEWKRLDDTVGRSDKAADHTPSKPSRDFLHLMNP